MSNICFFVDSRRKEVWLLCSERLCLHKEYCTQKGLYWLNIMPQRRSCNICANSAGTFSTDEPLHQKPQDPSPQMLHWVSIQRRDQVYLHWPNCVTGNGHLPLHDLCKCDLHIIFREYAKNTRNRLICNLCFPGAWVSEKLCSEDCWRPTKPGSGGEDCVPYRSGHATGTRH